MRRSLDDSRHWPEPEPDDIPIKPRLDGGITGYVVIIISMILFGYLMFACAPFQKSLEDYGITIKGPTTQMIIQDVTQTTAYFIGKKYPEFGTELLEYTKDFLNQEGNELVNFQYWKEYVAGSLVKDEFLRLKFMRLLNLVDLDLQADDPLKQVQMIVDLWREFVSGLQAGINVR